ncbi:MAG: hypothetical protein CVV41_21160 [Candidatus Riflebacteria bacterium HGW-Riflebacteria-1]|jgi:PAS domain S-box-containing protein|nr:MAG: hypothetical protein CVV41_21160 [Candidatus Riflebacteria bacterium HGW-Riflebacteria-1]
MKRLIKNMSISTMLTISIMVVTFAALASFFSVASYFDIVHFRDTVSMQSGMIARLAAEYNVSELVFGYKKEAEENLEKLFLLPEIEEAQIYDANGNLFTSCTRQGIIATCPQNIGDVKTASQKRLGARLEILQPMTFRDTRHGTLRLVASNATFQDYFTSRLRTMLISLAMVLFLSILLARIIQSWLSSPISQLIKKVQEMAGGNLASRVSVPDTGGEIATLCQNVNIMADALDSRIREVENSRQLLQAVSDYVPAGIFWKDRESKYVWANLLFAKSAGLGDPGEIAGKTDFDMPWRDSAEEHRESDRRVFNSGQAELNISKKVRRKDGSEIWVAGSKVPLHDNDGQVSGLIGSYIDITQQKETEEAMKMLMQKDKEAAARYEALIGASNTGAWEYHADSGFLWCSPEYFSMLGCDIKDFDQSGKANLEQTWLELLHQEDRDKAMQCFAGYMKNPEGMYQQNFRMRHHDGRWIWIWSRGKTLRDAEGQPTPVTIGTHIDVTDRIMLEDRLRHGEKMEAIGQLAGGVAHDFNNQLSGILGFAELLAKKLENEPQLKKMAESIMTSALRSADLTRQLLAFARKGKFVSTPVDAHHLIAEVISLLQHSIDRRITITQQLEAAIPVVAGDPGQLQNAILNLAINARDAMPEGGTLSFSTKNIDIHEKVMGHDLPPGSYLQICVSDTGTGMNEEVKSRLFEPFFTTKQHGKGTGLGLAATYGAIKNHGGAISVYTELHKGTTFRVLLPVGKHDGQPEVHISKSSGCIPGKGNILLVDDETIVREATAKILEDLGYKVLECRDGEEAAELFRAISHDVDAVILDMVMPRLAGPETFAAMRAINPSVKVLLASGFSINGAASGLLKAGAAGFLQKPYQIDELSQKLHEILRS